jgi:hypothetical protein
VLESELPGQGSLEVNLKELDMPAATGLEVHGDLVGRAIVAVHKGNIGEDVRYAVEASFG